MSSNKRRNTETYNNSNSKRRKLNPDNENYNISNFRRKLDPNNILEIKKRQENYYNNNNSKDYDNYIEINHCKEAIQMAVDIALKKTGGKTKNKKTNKNKKTKKRRKTQKKKT
jgi:hypothetical protein